MMLLDYFGVFGWISGKRDEISKSWQFRGPTPRAKAWLRGSFGQASGMSRCSKAMLRQRPKLQQRLTPQHSNSMPWCSIVHRHVFLSGFAIPLFQRLVYWTNEDPIGV